jgi:gliding motility-associated-like protein
VTVTSAGGCTATDSIYVLVDCSDLYFPTAFTPDGNGKNESFGALGNLLSISKYSLRVFNRWGALVFSTSDPLKKWNGKINGKDPGTQVFVWIAEYELNSRKGKQMQKGTVSTIR